MEERLAYVCKPPNTPIDDVGCVRHTRGVPSLISHIPDEALATNVKRCQRSVSTQAEPGTCHGDQRELRGAIHHMKEIMTPGLLRVERQEGKWDDTQAAPDQIQHPPAEQEPER